MLYKLMAAAMAGGSCAAVRLMRMIWVNTITIDIDVYRATADMISIYHTAVCSINTYTYGPATCYSDDFGISNVSPTRTPDNANLFPGSLVIWNGR